MFKTEKYQRLTGFAPARVHDNGLLMNPNNFRAWQKLFDRLSSRRLQPNLMRPSFYNAWCLRWNAHYLSTALGFTSKEPAIR